MNERSVNTIIVKSLNVIGKKISDGGFASRGRFTQNPFDGFGIHKIGDAKKNIYFESKFSNGLKAFNLDRIAPHQAEALDKFAEGEGSLCVVPFGAHAKRGDLRIYLFLWSYLRDKYYSTDTIKYENTIYHIPVKPQTITKKELEQLPFEQVKCGKIDFQTFIE